MKHKRLWIACGGAVLPIAALLVPSDDDASPAELHARQLVREGREVFRHDTFGDEAFWGGALRLHEAIATVSPIAALGLGLKVDVDALDPATRRAIAAGQVPLGDPAVTLSLLQQNAVVGVRGFFAGRSLQSVGITCALCHSTVDDALAPGIGHRRDGWPNRDLDVGAIIASAPDLSPFQNLLGVPRATVEAVLHSWGPGRFDAHLLLDGQAFQPSGASAAVVIPAAFGLGGVNLATYEGWGGVAHWNAFVGTLEMGGMGTLYEPRLSDPVKYPVAAANGLGIKHSHPDQLTRKLHPLQMYELSLPVPEPPDGSFDPRAAARGERSFMNACARCHVPGLGTEPGFNMHTAAEIGIDDFQARRGPWDRYRTTPLRALFTKSKGGYYHDGRFVTLSDVVEHYDGFFALGLNAAEKSDLVEYLKSL